MASLHGPRFTWIDTLHLCVALLYVVGIFTKLPEFVFAQYKDTYFDEIAIFNLGFFAVYMTVAATFFLYRWRNERYKVLDALAEGEANLTAAKNERDEARDLLEATRALEGRAATDLEYLVQWCSEVRHSLMCVMRKSITLPDHPSGAPQTAAVATDYLSVMRTFGPTFLSN